MNRVMFAVIVLICLIMVLTGCANKEAPRYVVDVTEVNIPIAEKAVAPSELFRQPIPVDQLMNWVEPQNSAATVCLTSAGESQLKSLVRRDESLLDGWEKYGSFDIVP